MPSNHLILCHPLLLLPSIFPSIRIVSRKSAFCIRWPKYWSSRFCINPSIDYSGLISFRIDWFDLFAFHGTQESSPTPPLKRINFSALSLFDCPALTSIHDYWKNHSFDYKDLCLQGERSSDPTGDWPRLAHECPGVSGRGVSSQWPAAGSGHWGQQCVYWTFWRRSPLSSLFPP